MMIKQKRNYLNIIWLWPTSKPRIFYIIYTKENLYAFIEKEAFTQITSLRQNFFSRCLVQIYLLQKHLLYNTQKKHRINKNSIFFKRLYLYTWIYEEEKHIIHQIYLIQILTWLYISSLTYYRPICLRLFFFFKTFLFIYN